MGACSHHLHCLVSASQDLTGDAGRIEDYVAEGFWPIAQDLARRTSRAQPGP
jgi:hypothetical protein